MENTFWNISTDVNFVDMFKASFKLYVDSGMRKKVEAAVDKWRNEQGGQWVTENFKEKFHNIIIEHYLPHLEERKIESWLQMLMRKIHRE